MLVIVLAVILVSSFFASMIQSAGYKVRVTDLRDATNSGYLIDEETGQATTTKVNGEVVSGILFMPKDASASNKKPAVVLTHGYLNNRELQLQNAIELARRGFIVLTIDRGGHGNNLPTSDTSAMMNTSGMYDSVKYLYNLPEVDKTKIGISGHSMGGFTTAMTLMQDASVGIISAGLMQGWDSFMGAGADVSVGILKAMDDEFFFGSEFADGTESICREYLQSVGAAKFVGASYTEGDKSSIDIKSGGIYVNGQLTTTSDDGSAVGQPFRVIYEANEIHPLNHFSTESASYIVDFFYKAFGTPDGNDFIAGGNQIWWIKEAFSTIGLAAFFVLIFPVVSLLLTLPCFASLRKKEELDLDADLPSIKKGGLCGITNTVTYFAGGLACMLFGGFILNKAYLEWGPRIFPQGTYFPQDTTGSVAGWAVICAAFGLTVMGVMWLVKAIVAKVASSKGKETLAVGNPFACAKIGIADFLKTIFLAIVVIALLYLVEHGFEYLPGAACDDLREIFDRKLLVGAVLVVVDLDDLVAEVLELVGQAGSEGELDVLGQRFGEAAFVLDVGSDAPAAEGDRRIVPEQPPLVYGHGRHARAYLHEGDSVLLLGVGEHGLRHGRRREDLACRSHSDVV